jgi:hypothetical protein
MGRLFKTASILSTARVSSTWMRRLGPVRTRVLVEKIVGFGIRAAVSTYAYFVSVTKSPLQDTLLPCESRYRTDMPQAGKEAHPKHVLALESHGGIGHSTIISFLH